MFVSIYHCNVCGTKWKKKTRRCPTDDDPCPPCPNLNCGEVPRSIGLDLTLNKAPGIIGQNIAVKAVDETAKIVMEDHGLTDLQSSIREGDSMAPKLPPAMQAQADNVFGRKRNGPMQVMAYGPEGRKLITMPSTPQLHPTYLRASALSGGLRSGTPNPVSDLHSAPVDVRDAIRPPTRVVAST